MAMIVVAAIGITIVASLLLLSTDSTNSQIVRADSARAHGLASACAERALNQLRLSASYSGNETVTLPNGTCQIENVLGSGTTNRTIQASATLGSAVEKLVVVVSSTQPYLIIGSWKEEDF